MPRPERSVLLIVTALFCPLLPLGLTGCEKKPAEMVRVPAGEFLMGTDEADADNEALEFGLPHPWYEDEHPLHRVNLPAFYIDAYEVTNEKYKRFVDAVKRPLPDDWMNGTYPEGQARFPVAYVTWFDADEYCRWAGKRLPTEEEWEKAARGPDSFKYPWGNLFNPAPAHISKGPVMFASAVAVGQYERGKSPYGAYDMIGNVWEWTAGWYQPYPGNEAKNENFGRVFRATRGLSFMGIGHYPPDAYMKVAAIIARASFRSYDYPNSRLTDLGFRCARPAMWYDVVM
ncbi:MAG: SUMF1/EgtB/PvdO family nonheme iron enzyme [Nitrospirae bacterium]|nr:SUMF1/EgtB/PvdO family nonheme iron enzyme [Nitrospirota bacterium]